MAVKPEATGKLSCHGATAVLYHSMYANVATGPRSRLKQGFVCNSGQHLHASEHEDEEQVWARLLQPGRINNNETPLTPAVLNTTCKKVGDAPMHDPGPE